MKTQAIFLFLLFCTVTVFSQAPTDKEVKKQQDGIAPPKTNETVEGKRDSTIQVVGQEIKQGHKLIGTYLRKSVTANGKTLNVISIYFPYGTVLAAEATEEDTDSKSYKIVTIKDDKIHYVTVTLTGQEVREIAKYLSDNFYL